MLKSRFELNLLKKTKVIGSLISLAVLSLPGAAQAESYYGIAQNGTTNLKGGHFVATVNSLNSAWSSTYNWRFILHTMWLITDANQSWIENGFMDGGIEEPNMPIVYHNGFYTARGVRNSSNETTDYNERIVIGPSTAINSTHKFHILNTAGTTNWVVFINDVQRLTWSTGTSSAIRMDVGLETNTANSTSAQWNEREFTYLHSGAWRYWGSGTLPSKTVGISSAWDVYPTSIKTSKVIP